MSELNHPLLERYNPFRDPAWRHNRVLEMVDHKPKPLQPDRDYDDEIIKMYRDFLLKWNKGNADTRVRLFHNNPGLFYAHNWRSHPDQDWRALLEARILAREPDEFIAEEFSTIPETVQYYEKLFFNVRDRLHSRTYIVKTVLGPSANQIAGVEGLMTDVMRRTSYKLFGYYGGPLILDIIISGFEAGPFPQKPEKAREWLDAAIKTTIQQRASLAARCFVVNKWSVMQLLEIQQRFMQSAEDARLAGGGASGDYQASIEKFFESIPLAVGNRAAEGRSEQSVLFDKSNAEPNFIEQMALSKGQVPEEFQRKLEFRRPEAVEKDVAHANETDG